MARNESIRVMAMFLLLAGPGAVDGHAGDWKHMVQACGHARDELRGKDAKGNEVKATGAEKRADIEDCGIKFYGLTPLGPQIGSIAPQGSIGLRNSISEDSYASAFQKRTCRPEEQRERLHGPRALLS